MKTAKEILESGNTPEAIIQELKRKTTIVPPWSKLNEEYDPDKHPVMTDPSYRDTITKEGIEKVTRIPIALQKLATKRMTQLMFGIPVKRIYKTKTTREEEVAQVIEKILNRNRIDTMNIERGKMLFAGCEFATLWYATEEDNSSYGIQSAIKIRSRNFSPMEGHSLYPLFNEMDDLIALSFEYKYETNEGKTITYFDTYTKETHARFNDTSGKWELELSEENAAGKIPAVYLHRPEPIWEDSSNNVYEIEWTLSRNGNYIRRNSKPIFAIFSDEQIITNTENQNGARAVVQYPSSAKANYVTWSQSTESSKMQIENLYRIFYTQLQLPDMSFDQMKTTPMSGEARKMMFIDAQLKVTEEAGRWTEILDREINVIKEFVKAMMPTYIKEIETLEVEQEITPFKINDETETIKNLTTATGGKAIISQLDAIRMLGWSDDPQTELDQIKAEETSDLFEPTE